MSVSRLPLRIRAAALVVLALLAGCAGLGGTRVVTLDERQLAALVEREFPFDRRLLELVDVRVGAPRVRLLPESNRLATELDVALSDRLFGKGFNGRLALDYALRIDPASQSVRLADVRVGRLGIEGLDARYAAAANAIGPMIAEQLLADLPVYRFRPEDFEGQFGGRMEPGAVTVTSRGVEITLKPVR
jgi:hypothetical protein